MHPLEQEIKEVMEQFHSGNLNVDEKNYLLEEIRDVKAAQSCADNEQMFRYLVNACNIAISMA